MSTNSETFIGKVRSVTGSQILVQLDSERVTSTMPMINGILYRIGQIGSFIKIPVGHVHLFGVVTKAGADALTDNLKNINLEKIFETGYSRWLSVVLIGERIGKRFERGVSQYPTADDEVHLVTIEDLEIVYGGFNKDSAITVGQISASESLPAQFDINKLVTRHCAVLGSTGSGKSNAVSIIVDAIAKNKELISSRILIIDPHGEYSESLINHSIVYKLNPNTKLNQKELVIPYWALPFEELISIFSGKLNDAQKDYVRQEVNKRKVESSKKMSHIPEELSVTSDSPIPFSLKDLWFYLDDFERQTFSDTGRSVKTPLTQVGDSEKMISNKYTPASPGGGAPFLNNRAQGILSFLDTIRHKVLDERYKFLFRPKDYEPKIDGTVVSDLDKLLVNWLGHGKSVTILDLSGIPPEIMISVSGALLKIIYDSLYWGQNLNIGGRKQPLLIILEEAHNYLKAGEDSISSRSVQTIAKEGRKYGVGLLLVTQRPSELDETVLSQCGSVIALRMTNNKDRAFVSSAIQEDLHDLICLLPSLRTGEGLIMGEMVKIPSRIRFDRISKAPSSTDPIVSDEWKKEKPDSALYIEVLKLWRNGIFQ
ncbi:MAG: ATP-binding protein [Ignavibacteria bacterium]|nr:ATP-binding protein [Ignavibacteria bacterium]